MTERRQTMKPLVEVTEQVDPDLAGAALHGMAEPVADGASAGVLLTVGGYQNPRQVIGRSGEVPEDQRALRAAR
jgi:hypothetical protein